MRLPGSVLAGFRAPRLSSSFPPFRHLPREASQRQLRGLSTSALLSAKRTEKPSSIPPFAAGEAQAAVSVEGEKIVERGEPVSDPGLPRPSPSPEDAAAEGDGLDKGKDGIVRGRLSSTNSHLLRLTLPLPDEHHPVAFVLHPSQPLSYLARLIEAELPAGSVGHVAFGGLGREGTLRWSEATEVGEFIVQAAKKQKFSIRLSPPKEQAERDEGTTLEVVVPSFRERTRFLVARLRAINAALESLGEIKEKCDRQARAGAKRLAAAGLGGLVGYGALVFRLTFWDLGWDIMEPVTYLIGHGALISGYVFWLLRQRQPNYDALLEGSVSTRQAKLYREHGFDISRHRALSAEGVRIREAIRKIAFEYGIDWDEDLKAQGKEVRLNVALEEKSNREGKEEGIPDKQAKHEGGQEASEQARTETKDGA